MDDVPAKEKYEHPFVHPFCDVCEKDFPLEELYSCDESGEGIRMRICRSCEVEGIEEVKKMELGNFSMTELMAKDLIKLIKERIDCPKCRRLKKEIRRKTMTKLSASFRGKKLDNVVGIGFRIYGDLNAISILCNLRRNKRDIENEGNGILRYYINGEAKSVLVRPLDLLHGDLSYGKECRSRILFEIINKKEIQKDD